MWYKIDDTKPQIGQWVLVWDGAKSTPEVYSAYLDEDEAGMFWEMFTGRQVSTDLCQFWAPFTTSINECY